MNENSHATPNFGAAVRLGSYPEQPLRLLRLADVVERVALGKSTIYALIARNEFPLPLHLGNASRWLEHEVDEWIQCQLRKRQPA
jgi:prophage regulatory protein